METDYGQWDEYTLLWMALKVSRLGEGRLLWPMEDTPPECASTAKHPGKAFRPDVRGAGLEADRLVLKDT